MTSRSFACGGAILIAVGILYAPLFSYFWTHWIQVPLYSHGFLIPLVSLYLVWRSGQNLRTTPIRGSRVGLSACALFLTLGLLANLAEVRVILAYSLIGLINGAVLFLFGWKFLKTLLFPINFLLFMIPVQHAIIAPLSMWMKIVSAKGAARVVDALGFPTVREGVDLHFGDGISLAVADPCSGIRSLMALMALGAVYAYLWQGPTWKKLVLFSATLPIVLVANCVRVALLSISAIVFGMPNVLESPVHSMTGVLVFIIALFCLVAAGRILECRLLTKDI